MKAIFKSKNSIMDKLLAACSAERKLCSLHSIMDKLLVACSADRKLCSLHSCRLVHWSLRKASCASFKRTCSIVQENMVLRAVSRSSRLLMISRKIAYFVQILATR